MTEMQKAKASALADRVAQKAADTLSGLHREMEIMKWPDEFRAIMWGAVSQHAAILEAEARSRSLGEGPRKSEEG